MELSSKHRLCDLFHKGKLLISFKKQHVRSTTNASLSICRVPVCATQPSFLNASGFLDSTENKKIHSTWKSGLWRRH